jgi:hypothetical protein
MDLNPILEQLLSSDKNTRDHAEALIQHMVSSDRALIVDNSLGIEHKISPIALGHLKTQRRTASTKKTLYNIAEGYIVQKQKCA